MMVDWGETNKFSTFSLVEGLYSIFYFLAG